MKKYGNIILAATAVLMMASCSEEEAILTAPEEVIERIDMVLEGNETEYVYLQSLENNTSEDLVQYNYYGDGSNQIDFKVNLDDNRTLVFKVVNEIIANPWTVEESYSIFASQDLEDKQRYVSVELISGGETAEYMSHTGESFPQGTYLNVFSIEDFDPSNNEIFCRVVDLPLKAVSGQSQILTINGTFRGALTIE